MLTPDHAALLARLRAVEEAIDVTARCAEDEQRLSHAEQMEAHYLRALDELFRHRGALKLLLLCRPRC
jgi:hypothetical protein